MTCREEHNRAMNRNRPVGLPLLPSTLVFVSFLVKRENRLILLKRPIFTLLVP